MGTHSAKDLWLREQLTRLRSTHVDHWSYGSRSSNANRTALFQYPAMMVADMQRDLLEALLAESATTLRGPVFDPFIGSGTVLGAAMSLGHDVIGWDINPLAILICRVKAGPFHLSAFELAAERVAAGPRWTSAPEARFANWRHWFTDDVARGLTAIRTAIMREPQAATRRFLWVCLAETVRLTSNSRTSTVKLHRRTAEQIVCRPDPHQVFERIATTNLQRLADARDDLVDAEVMTRGGWYRGLVSLELGDARTLPWRGPQSETIITSPPYGDNTSTVPYGQHAYLPLQWIEFADIHPAADPDCLRTTYEIDRLSLGGIRNVNAAEEADLRRQSPSLDRILSALTAAKPDRRNRILGFTRDFDNAVRAIAPCLRQGGTAAWTVGSRRVGGQFVPLADILEQLGRHHGLTKIETLHREIPAHRKRMASKNTVGATMQREQVVVLRRSPCAT